jgi:hypothetical protein
MTVISLSVFIGLLGYALLFEREFEVKSEWTLEKVFELEKDKIEKIRIKHGKTEIVCNKKKEDTWELRKPVKDKMKPEAVKELLETITELMWYRELKVKKEELPEFGLDKPALTLSFWTEKKKEYRLSLGKETPVSGCLYAQKKGVPRVYLVGKDILEKLKKPVEDLRREEIFEFKKEDIVKVSLNFSDKVITCQKKEEDEKKTWFITTPIQTKADDWEVENIIATVKNLKVKEFIAESCSEPSVYGLAKPESVELETQDGVKKKLLIGSKEDDEGIYVQHGARANVYLVEEYDITALRKGLDELRDKYIFKFDEKEVKKLVLSQKGQKKIVCVRRADFWEIIKPLKAKADKYVVEGVIRDLKHLRVKKFLSLKGKLQHYGLKPPEIEVSVFLGPKKRPGLLVGIENKDEDYYYAVKKGDAKIFGIAPWAKENFQKTLFDLREKKIVDFSNDRVLNFKLELEGEPVLQGVRKSKKVWEVNGKKVKTSRVNSLLWSIKGLTAKKFLSRQDISFRKPYLEVWLEVEEEKKGRRKIRLILIRKGKKEYFARAEDFGEMVQVDHWNVKSLCEKITEFVKKKKRDTE